MRTVVLYKSHFFAYGYKITIAIEIIEKNAEEF